MHTPPFMHGAVEHESVVVAVVVVEVDVDVVDVVVGFWTAPPPQTQQT